MVGVVSIISSLYAKLCYIYINTFVFPSTQSGTYTPCTFFDSVEFSRTLIDDHLLEPGYHPALLGLAREVKGLNFQFEHDLMGLSE